MGYAGEELGKNEILVSETNVNLIAILPDVLLAILILFFSMSRYIFSMSRNMLRLLGISYFSIIESIILGGIIAVLIVVIKLLRMKNTKLALTNKKIMGKVGILSTKVMNSPLNKIISVSVEHGLGGKIFGYGKIVITTSAGNYNFSFISQPDVFRNTVMNQIDAFDEERIRKQAEEIAKAMKR